jgi:SAM-dependent methyltransferase
MILLELARKPKWDCDNGPTNSELSVIYDRQASNYDKEHMRSSSALNYIEVQRLRHLTPCIEKIENKRIYDVSCGTGTYLSMLKKNENYCLGGDISREMVTISKTKGVEDTIVNDYHYIPIKDKSFDLILCVNSIHYSYDAKKVLTELKRILADDGRIILTYFNLLNFRSLNLVRRRYKKNSQVRFENRYLSLQMNAKFREVGLIPVKQCGINALPYPANSKERSKTILQLFNLLEYSLNESILRHLFNETYVELRKETNRNHENLDRLV